MRVLRIAVMGLVLLGTGQLSGGQVQQPMPQRQQQPGYPGSGRTPGDDVGPSPEIVRKQAQSLNSERQKKLVADTEKLLALATELKQDVDKTNKDIMSVDVIKKADEIEKLAHSVKERMKG